MRTRCAILRRMAWAAMAAMLCASAAATAGERAPTLRDVREWDWAQGQTWADIAGQPRISAAAQIEYAYALEKDRRWLDAAGQYFLAVKAWPAGPEAPLALQRLAVALYKLADHHRAFRAVDQIFESYPAHVAQKGMPEKLLGIELLIGNRLVDLAAVAPSRGGTTVHGIPIPSPAAYKDYADDVFNVMVMRLDALLAMANRDGDAAAKDNYLALGRAVRRGKDRLKKVEVRVDAR